MKCCKKSAIVAVALVVGLVLASRTSWGEYAWTQVKGVFKSAVTPEMQIGRLNQQINKLDKDIDKGWTAIAQREKEIEKLKKEMEGSQVWLERNKIEMLQASADLENKVKRVRYRGTEISDSLARKQLLDDARVYASKQKTLASQEKLLESLQKEYMAVKAQQNELVNAKQQMADRLAAVKADLETLKVAQTRSKFPAGDNSRLNDIKETLNALEEDIAVRMRAQQLSNEHQTNEQIGAPTGKDTTLANDEVIRRIKQVTGQNVEVGNGE